MKPWQNASATLLSLSLSASFRALLPSSYEFKFFDGQKLCSPSPQIADFYPGPYRCWYDSPARSKVESAHRYVMGLAAEEKGGFDVVMGFSQVWTLPLYHHKFLEDSHRFIGCCSRRIDSPLPPNCIPGSSSSIQSSNFHLLASSVLALSRPWYRCPKVLWSRCFSTSKSQETYGSSKNSNSGAVFSTKQ